MTKQKREPSPQGVFDLLMVVGFEGDKCTIVRIQNPTLNWKQIGSMGVKLKKLADTMFQKKSIETNMQAIDEELHSLTYGDTL